MFCANLGAIVGSVAAATYWLNKYTSTYSTQVGGIGTDSSNNVYVLSGDNPCCLVKYNAAGAIQWQKDLYNSGTGVSFFGIATSSAGNCYLFNGGDLMKISSAGAITWQKALSGIPNTLFSGSPIAIDASENIHIGYQATNGAGVMKLSSAGAVTWQKYLIPAALPATPQGIAVDSSGNVFSAFLADVAAVGANLFVAKHSSAGALLWQKDSALTEFGSGQSSGQCVVVDSGGNMIYLSNDTSTSTFVTKLNTSGVVQWSKTLNILNSAGYGNSITVDSLDNIYVATAEFSAPNYSTCLVKLSSTGGMIFSRRITGGGSEMPMGIRVSAAGSIVVNHEPLGSSVPLQLPADGTKTGTYGGYTYSTLAKTSTTRTSSLTTSTMSAGTDTLTVANTGYSIVTATNSNTFTAIP